MIDIDESKKAKSNLKNTSKKVELTIKPRILI